MTAFRYRALNPDGKLVRGVLEGDSERQVRTQLRGQSLRPVEVAVANRAEPAANEWRMPLLRRGISTGDLALLTRQLAALRQVFQDIPHQGFRPSVRIVGTGVDQIDSRTQGESQCVCVMAHPAADPIPAETGLTDLQPGAAKGNISDRGIKGGIFSRGLFSCMTLNHKL